MTSPSGSTLSILRGYDPSNPHIASFERGNYAHRSASYTHCLREVVVTCLLVISNREIPKITVHSNRRGAFYPGSFSSDGEESLFRVRVKERTLTIGREMMSSVCLVRGTLRRFPLATGI